MSSVLTYTQGLESWPFPLNRCWVQSFLVDQWEQQSQSPRKLDLMACLCSWSITLNSQVYRLQPQWNETTLELQWTPVTSTSLATTDQLFQLRIPSHATSSSVQHYELWFHQYQTWLDVLNHRLILQNESMSTSTSSQYIPVEFEWSSSQDGHGLHMNVLNATTHEPFEWNIYQVGNSVVQEFTDVTHTTTQTSTQPTSWRVQCEWLRPLFFYSSSSSSSETSTSTETSSSSTSSSIWWTVWLIPCIAMVIIFIGFLFWFYHQSTHIPSYLEDPNEFPFSLSQQKELSAVKQ